MSFYCLNTRLIREGVCGEEKGGGTNERPGTDHVTSGPMRGREKNCTQWRKQTHTHTDRQTDGHGDSMTESVH